MLEESPRSGRVLVANDQEHMRSLLETCFQNAGYEVESVEDGAGALARLEATRPPDVLILDLAASRDGDAVLEQLKRRADAPPVVVLTGNEADADFRPAPEGAAVTLARPFTFPVLLGICEALVLAACLPTGEPKRS
jgi:two-component system alkaline phosphatase synthesis response regulator PhoP